MELRSLPVPDDVLALNSDPFSQDFTGPSPPPAPEPAAPAPGADRYSPRIDQLLDRQQNYIDRAAASMDRQSDILERKVVDLAPYRQRQLEMASQPIPEPPTPKQPPAPPQRGDRHQDENWLMAAGLLGALAGGLTRRHATNALAAFSGAIEGYSQGSRQA